MNDNNEILQKLKKLEMEVEFLRARNDVLAIALDHVINRSIDPLTIRDQIGKRLFATSAQANASLFSEEYVTAFDAAVQRFSK